MTTQIKSDHIGIERAATILGVTVGRVRQLAIAGRVPSALKVNERAWLFSEAAIQSYAKTRK